jgi:hypothetical protein
MKKFTTVLLSLMSGALMAQIPNPSFENWTSGAPNGWNVLTAAYLPGGVTQSANAHAGTSAVQLNTVALGPYYESGSIETGGSSGYVINAGNVASVSGWYILSLAGTDEFAIGVNTKCASNTLSSTGAAIIKTNTAVYKQFTVTQVVSNACTTDSLNISFSIFNGSGYTTPGSTVTIDDLSLTPAGLDEISNNVTLEKAYPNPANNFCNIIYSLPSDGLVNISLYDISGRKIETLLSNTQQSNGRYKLPVDVSTLASGIYVYTITVNGQSYAQKLTVSR